MAFMDFKTRVLSGQIKTAGGFGSVVAGLGRILSPTAKATASGLASTGVSLGQKAVAGAPGLWNSLKSGTKAFGRGLVHPRTQVGLGAATVGANMINNRVATGDWTRPIDAATIPGNYDNTIRPLVGAGLLLGAPTAAYLMAKNTETDDEV